MRATLPGIELEQPGVNRRGQSQEFKKKVAPHTHRREMGVVQTQRSP